jgi:hypothetical protein
MLSFKYLQGIYFERMEGLPSIYLIAHGKDRTDFRVVGSYLDEKNHFHKISRKLKEMGKGEEAEHLEIHHIIEPVHFASVNFQGQLEKWIKYELPCVLLSRKEHGFYNHFLNIPPQDERFRDLPSADWIEKSLETVQKAQEAQYYDELIGHLENIQSLYYAAYEGDQYLQKIVRNVLAEVKRYLPASQ